jgi:hypothetical protein
LRGPESGKRIPVIPLNPGLPPSSDRDAAPAAVRRKSYRAAPGYAIVRSAASSAELRTIAKPIPRRLSVRPSQARPSVQRTFAKPDPPESVCGTGAAPWYGGDRNPFTAPWRVPTARRTAFRWSPAAAARSSSIGVRVCQSLPAVPVAWMLPIAARRQSSSRSGDPAPSPRRRHTRSRT